MFKRIFILSLLMINGAQAFLSKEVAQKIRHGVVSIDKVSSVSPYRESGQLSVFGSGFFVDAKLGLFATNQHVILDDSPGLVDVTFSTGEEARGRVVYTDPWIDFAFVKVDPQHIPASTKPLELVRGDQELDTEIHMIGQNAGQNFSTQSGYLSSLYEIVKPLSFQSFRVSLNARGGASGSPACLKDGRVMGIIYGSDSQTSAFGIKADYLIDALDVLRQNKQPLRQNIGALLKYESLDKVARYGGFPSREKDAYMAKYPDVYNKVLRVETVFSDAPAAGKLLPGDVLWAINDQVFGPHLYLLEKAMNDAKGPVKVTFYRHGKKIDITLNLENLHDHVCNKMIVFGGGVFFEADDEMRRILGCKKKSLLLCNVRPGGAFHGVFQQPPGGERIYMKILKMGAFDLRTLKDLEKAIPALVEKGDFEIQFKNYGMYMGFNNQPYFARSPEYGSIAHSELDQIPMLYHLNDQSHVWETQSIK